MLKIPKHLFDERGRLCIDPNIAIKNEAPDRNIQVALSFTEDGEMTVIVTKSTDGRPS